MPSLNSRPSTVWRKYSNEVRKEDVETAGREIRSKVYVPCRNFDQPLPHLLESFKLDFSSNYHSDNDAVFLRSLIVKEDEIAYEF